MRNVLSRLAEFFYRVLASTRFFIFSIGLFLVHTIWLALSAVSLPFDEYYHLGIIKFYSYQWSPFIFSQPDNMSYVGDITRLPSYLYHYLMSFPYRVLDLVISSEYWLVVSMRFINIVIVIIGIVLFRKLMLRLNLSRRLTHLTLFVFMLTPLIVYLASEANYDNLMFLLTPIFLGFALNLYKRRFTTGNIVGYIAVACLAALVKNQFIVIAGLISIYLLVSFVNRRPKNIIKSIRQDFLSKNILIRALLTFTLLISVGLFVERHGTNFVHYKSIKVQCQNIQPFEVCKNYSPWWRNYRAKQNPLEEPKHGGVLGFSGHWLKTIARGFVANFANVPSLAVDDDPYGNYEFSPLLAQMIIMSYVAMGVFIGGVVFYIKKWWQVGWLRATILITVFYGLVLWGVNLRGYLAHGRAYAIQPRYLLPLIIPIIASVLYFAGLSIRRRDARSSLAALMVIVFIYSGGAFGWFIRSNSGWYWPSDKIISTNKNIQKVLRKVIYNTELPK